MDTAGFKALATDVAHTWEPTSLYVHIPFCASRCHYCDFTTFVAPRNVMDAYVGQLCEDLARTSSRTTKSLQTVFFGGGTPTALSASQLQRVVGAVRQHFDLAPGHEWTFEANPGTVTPEKLRVLREAGVNRLSFGAQTFDDRLLMSIGRSHDADAVRDSVAMAQDAGFAHINVDLMFGLPEQRTEDVEQALSEVINLGVDHVSAYWLKVEPGTPFARWQEAGLLPLPGEDAEADMYDIVRARLQTAGFGHYEVSNFARPDGEARHNLVYWRNEPYLAAGVGAHGYAGGERYENVKSLSEYASLVEAGKHPVREAHRVNTQEAMEDTMMLGLRLQEGVTRSRFQSRHNRTMEEAFPEGIRWGISQGLLAWVEDALCLTEKAWPIANLVFERFID